MNQNQGGNDARHDDNSSLIDFLASLYEFFVVLKLISLSIF